MSLTIKFALFISMLCLMLVGGLTWFSYQTAKGDLEDSIGERLQAVVSSGAFGIDGDLHDSIRSKEDTEGEAFIKIRDHLRMLKEANNLKEEIYTFRNKGEKLEFVVMTHQRPFYGDEYGIREAMRPTLIDGKPARTGLYEDSNGHWISAYAPIFDSQGQVVGLLEADVRVEEFEVLLKQEALYLALKGSGFAGVGMILSFMLAGTVTRRLNYLTDLTEKISLGKMDTPIEVKGSDEVARLGASLERMRESLKIAAEMIE